MSPPLDDTHDPARASWVESAQGHPDFPIQNLPLGVFSPPGDGPRGGVAIGDAVLDIGAALAAGLFDECTREAAEAARGPTLNPLMALPAGARRRLRARLSSMLGTRTALAAAAEKSRTRVLHPAADCVMHLPARIANYTDFYAGIQHAINGGRRRGLSEPLAPNYRHLPVGYHGRSSSVRVSGTPIRRPCGQFLEPGARTPTFAPSRKLDYELEIAAWIGPGNALGAPIPISAASEHVVGLGLLNDWSARDMQAWEMAPLGPFLCKSFGTLVSPWVVTVEALAPFRVPQPARPESDPAPPPHLHDDADQASGAFDVAIEASLTSARMRDAGLPPQVTARTTMTALYWTVAQMVTHHASGGCNLEPGDLFGTGTISGATRDGVGSLVELTDDGRAPIALASGETRAFVEDGDEVVFRAHAARPGYVSIGFGECRGRIIG